jgi:molybdopterin molybdotransferase
MHLVRVALAERDGRLHARPTGDQSSGILLSMVRADALAVMPAEATLVAAGSEVVVQLLGRGDLRPEAGF